VTAVFAVDASKMPKGAGGLRRKIVVMSESLSSKIAAGEVVERPASIVKELIENSLDAGATEINLELEKGGKKLIRLTDNGEGISHEDVPLVFERHATSKIYSFEELLEIGSFGFRGEALNSIASVSRVELLTKKGDSLSGTRMVLEGGVIRETSEAGCPDGTSIRVADIFYNTPARLKFLKQDATEKAHCLDIVTRLALANPGVKFVVTANGRTLLNIPRAETLAERVMSVLGDEIMHNSRPVEETRDCMTVSGFISAPHFTRSNTKGMLFHVNARPVRDGLLHNAVMSAYRRLIEPRRYPAVVLFMDVPAADVDINVHPTKMEVRFRDSRAVYTAVQQVISETLSDISGAEGPSLHRGAVEGRPGPDVDRYRAGVHEALTRYTIATGPEKMYFSPPEGKHLATPDPPDITPVRDGAEERLFFSSLEYQGQVDGTYLILAGPEVLVIIDQHAAHERVLFEKFRGASRAGGMEEQRLLFPEAVSLSPRSYALLSEYMELMKDAGFEIEPYGDATMMVRSVPSVLADVNVTELLVDCVEEILSTGKTENIEEIRDSVYTLMACKSAIKAHQRMTEPEVTALCRDLDQIPFASTCPHGRPLYVCFDAGDLEKMFKRK